MFLGGLREPVQTGGGELIGGGKGSRDPGGRGEERQAGRLAKQNA